MRASFAYCILCLLLIPVLASSLMISAGEAYSTHNGQALNHHVDPDAARSGANSVPTVMSLKQFVDMQPNWNEKLALYQYGSRRMRKLKMQRNSFSDYYGAEPNVGPWKRKSRGRNGSNRP